LALREGLNRTVEGTDELSVVTTQLVTFVQILNVFKAVQLESLGFKVEDSSHEQPSNGVDPQRFDLVPRFYDVRALEDGDVDSIMRLDLFVFLDQARVGFKSRL